MSTTTGRSPVGWPRSVAGFGLGLVLGVLATVAGERVRWGGSWLSVLAPVAVLVVVAAAVVLWRRRWWPVAAGAATGSVLMLAFAAALVSI